MFMNSSFNKSYLFFFSVVTYITVVQNAMLKRLIVLSEINVVYCVVGGGKVKWSVIHGVLMVSDE